MLERIVYDQIFDFLLENNVITKNQSAFRKLYSTVTSLVDSIDHLYENIDKKKLNLTIFLDLKKAFLEGKEACGIPQRCCLGPLLFIIYLNDLENCLKPPQASTYADHKKDQKSSPYPTGKFNPISTKQENRNDFFKSVKLQ